MKIAITSQGPDFSSQVDPRFGRAKNFIVVDKDIYFLLKAKCPVIARDIGCQMDSLVMRRSALPTASAVKG